MRRNWFCNIKTVGAFAALMLMARTSSGQITNIGNSDVEGFFGAQSDAPTAQQSEGPIAPSWPASGNPFYPITGGSGVPALYGTFPNPVYPITQNIGFAAPGGHSLSSPFVDSQGTTANYNIVGGFNGAGTLTSDAYVDFALPGATGMYLSQSSTATGYAYEQANFAIEYSVGPGGLIGGAVPSLPYIISGNAIAGRQCAIRRRAELLVGDDHSRHHNCQQRHQPRHGAIQLPGFERERPVWSDRESRTVHLARRHRIRFPGDYRRRLRGGRPV